MKKYVLAILLCIAVAPFIGAAVTGLCYGNPLLVFFPAVYPVAALLALMPVILFGVIGSYLHFNRIRNGTLVTARHKLFYGAGCGLLIAAVLVAFGGCDTAFLLAPIISGIVCVFAGARIVERHNSKGEPHAGGHSEHPA